MTTHDENSSPLIADPDERHRVLNRLKRLEGQVRGLQTMVESGQDCDAVLTQVRAAKAALDRVGLIIIGHSMKTCLMANENASREELVDEALEILRRYVSLPETWAASEDR